MGVCHCPRCVERRKNRVITDTKVVEVINQYVVATEKEKETLYERLRALILSAL